MNPRNPTNPTNLGIGNKQAKSQQKLGLWIHKSFNGFNRSYGA